jgi:hypothetical protein
VKFSFRQILASVGGAVIAATIASVFGVKGTIVGVAIGSAAATMGTALVAQSIERGQKAVKQVVVRAPDSSSLLRKLGATGSSGGTASSVDASPSGPAEAAATGEAVATGAAAETVEMQSATPSEETGRLEISAVADAPATERLRATTAPAAPAVRGGGRGAQRFSWPVIVGTTAIVFVLALLLIVAIELISGKPLGSIFGNAGNGNIFTPPSQTTTTTPTSNTTTTSTTTTTSPTSSTTTTSTTSASSSTSTSTTKPNGSSTTSTAPGVSSTTTTTGAGSSSTSTTVSGAATSP